jgi:hypothetical protein
MKKTLVLLALSLPFVSTNSYSQTWAPVGATWTYTVTFASSYAVDYGILTSVKDTVIDSQNCKEIQYQQGGDCNYASSFMYGDSDRVYFYDPPSDKFNLLYDFNKHTGETWYIKASGWSGGKDSLLVHVDSTATVVINGNTLKVLYTRIDNSAAGNWEGINGKITEKLGHEKFMFPLISGLCDEDFNSGLRCYQDSTIGFYQTGISPTCDYTTVGINEHSSSDEIYVSPNPASSEIQIISEQSTVISIDIFNTLGEKIYTSPFTNSRSPITINIAALPSGMYFAEIKSAKGITVKKFVKE